MDDGPWQCALFYHIQRLGVEVEVELEVVGVERTGTKEMNNVVMTNGPIETINQSEYQLHCTEPCNINTLFMSSKLCNPSNVPLKSL